MAAAQAAAQQNTPEATAQSSTAPPVPGKDGVYTDLGKWLVPPRLTKHKKPKYPRDAGKEHATGVSVIALVVGVDGLPREVKVARSAAEGLPESQKKIGAEFDEAAIEAVQNYRFVPATLRGKPVPILIHVQVSFAIFKW